MTYKLHDISHKEIAAGNVIILEDRMTGDMYSIKVDSVTHTSDTTRTITGNKIQKGNRGIAEAIPIKFTLVAGVPQLGLVIEQTELSELLTSDRDRGDIDNMIVYETQKLLSTKITKNYGMPLKELVLYLQNLGLLDKDFDTAHKYFVNLRRRFRELFESKGGFVFLIPENKRKEKTQDSQSPYKKTRVDFNKFTLGCRLLLESGVFGEVEFYNV